MTLRRVSKSQVSHYLWFAQVVIVLGLTSVVIWLSLIPKSPIFSITHVYIPALDGRNPTKNSSIVLSVETSNPNEGISIYYDDIYITLYYHDAIIGTNSVAGFYQGHKKATSCEVLVNVELQLWREVMGGIIDLRVALKTAVKYKIFRSKTKHHWMEFEANVPIGSGGRISGEKNVKLHRIAHSS